MVLLSADGSEEKVFKKITVADPTSCKKKKEKKRPSNPAVARNIWTQFWSRVWQFERTHLQKVQMPGGCRGSRGGGEKGGNVEAMN